MTSYQVASGPIFASNGGSSGFDNPLFGEQDGGDPFGDNQTAFQPAHFSSFGDSDATSMHKPPVPETWNQTAQAQPSLQSQWPAVEQPAASAPDHWASTYSVKPAGMDSATPEADQGSWPTPHPASDAPFQATQQKQTPPPPATAYTVAGTQLFQTPASGNTVDEDDWLNGGVGGSNQPAEPAHVAGMPAAPMSKSEPPYAAPAFAYNGNGAEFDGQQQGEYEDVAHAQANDAWGPDFGAGPVPQPHTHHHPEETATQEEHAEVAAYAPHEAPAAYTPTNASGAYAPHEAPAPQENFYYSQQPGYASLSQQGDGHSQSEWQAAPYSTYEAHPQTVGQDPAVSTDGPSYSQYFQPPAQQALYNPPPPPAPAASHPASPLAANFSGTTAGDGDLDGDAAFFDDISLDTDSPVQHRAPPNVTAAAAPGSTAPVVPPLRLPGAVAPSIAPVPAQVQAWAPTDSNNPPAQSAAPAAGAAVPPEEQRVYEVHGAGTQWTQTSAGASAVSSRTSTPHKANPNLEAGRQKVSTPLLLCILYHSPIIGPAIWACMR